MGGSTAERQIARDVLIPSNTVHLEGKLFVPAHANGLVLFVHGSGSRHHSPRNEFLMRSFHKSLMGTLLFDLLTTEEEEEDRYTGHLRFNLELLAKRLLTATQWLRNQEGLQPFPLGYFGSSTGAGAALVAAAALRTEIAVIVSCGGRPDLAGDALAAVTAPTLLLAGGCDEPVIELHQQAYERLRCEKQMVRVEGATHRFDEPGVVEEIARLTTEWFQRHFAEAVRV